MFEDVIASDTLLCELLSEINLTLCSEDPIALFAHSVASRRASAPPVAITVLDPLGLLVGTPYAATDGVYYSWQGRISEACLVAQQVYSLGLDVHVQHVGSECRLLVSKVRF